jgi:hypothetical protein
MEYRHTQIGWTITIVMLAILAFLLWTAGRIGELGVVGWAFLVFFGVLTVLFCTLNARVDDESLQVSFGPGLVRRRVALADIESATVYRLPWYAIAYGLRMNLKGTRQLWRVSGKWTVDLKLSGDQELFVGTDQPEALEAVIRSAIAQLPHRG